MKLSKNNDKDTKTAWHVRRWGSLSAHTRDKDTKTTSINVYLMPFEYNQCINLKLLLQTLGTSVSRVVKNIVEILERKLHIQKKTPGNSSEYLRNAVRF